MNTCILLCVHACVCILVKYYNYKNYNYYSMAVKAQCILGIHYSYPVLCDFPQLLDSIIKGDPWKKCDVAMSSTRWSKIPLLLIRIIIMIVTFFLFVYVCILAITCFDNKEV